MDRTTQSLLKEDRVHGDSMFPLAAYWVDIPSGTHVLDTHWHEEAEFFMLLEGEILFQVDTEYFTLRAGEAVFIESGDIHAAYILNEETPCRFCALVFLPDLLASAQFDTIQQNTILPLQEKRKSFPRHLTPAIPWHQDLLRHIERMMEAYASASPGFETFIKGTLLIMLSEIAMEDRSVNHSQQDADTTKINRLKKIILYIQDNYQEPIRTRDLSELIPMSEGQFCRFFKAMTRKTPVDFINSYRVRQAAELLQQSDRKISDIAFDVGFDNVSYFIKVFRKAMKCSPSEFRKSAIQGASQGQLYS